MKLWFRRRPVNCRKSSQRLRAIVEETASASFEECLAAIELGAREHVQLCSKCRTFLEDALAARRLLREGLVPATDAGPHFAARVMRGIAEREQRATTAESPWFAVSRMAARFAWASGIALLLVAGWIFQQQTVTPPKSSATELTADSFPEPARQPTTHDEVLWSLTEREP